VNGAKTVVDAMRIAGREEIDKTRIARMIGE
jgi:hypothetical protein